MNEISKVKYKKDKGHYDVVIIGAGISGAMLANQLSLKGKKVLILEAGLEKKLDYGSYQDYVDYFYTQQAKVPNSPYPNNTYAPQSNVLDINKILPDKPDTSGYFVQYGPLPFSSTNTRSLGGTTLHWLGICLRMLPNDFKLKSIYKQGVDWPFEYKHLKKYYEQAELEIGVSADVKDLKYPGTNNDYFGNYDYPMHKIPQTYLDKVLSKKLKGMQYDDMGERIDIDVVSIPQGRNSTPNIRYIDPRTKKPYVPKGAVGNSHEGMRCEGNSNCIPICPVQAKYNALKTLNEGKDPNRNHPIEIQFQSVVTSLEIDSDHGKINSIFYKKYKKVGDPASISYHKIEAKRYVLAGSAIENAKILLASGAAKTSGQVGKNLMDHPYMLTWALMPEKEYVGPFRGPFSSSGIPSLRDGNFRDRHSAFRTDIGNWGWNFPTGAPNSDLQSMVQNENLFGKKLRDTLYDRVQRQFRFGFLIEQLPNEYNRVCIDPEFKDDLDNYRPIIHYDLSDYEKSGFATAKNLSDQIFQRMGAAQYTSYNKSDAGYCEYEGQGYTYHGSGHIVGTHRMGTGKHNSVVNRNQKCWDHQNLYVIGCGSMPTIGTSNPTLTMAALVLKTADALYNDLSK